MIDIYFEFIFLVMIYHFVKREHKLAIKRFRPANLTVKRSMGTCDRFMTVSECLKTILKCSERLMEMVRNDEQSRTFYMINVPKSLRNHVQVHVNSFKKPFTLSFVWYAFYVEIVKQHF